MGKVETVVLGFEFLRKHAFAQDTFTVSEMVEATGWKRSSVKTYISKQWKGLLSSTGKGESKIYRVRREFLRITKEEFLSVATQKRLVVPQYQRAKHEVVIQFEFLLPLSKEEQLRRALDELFYADTLGTRILELGMQQLESVIERKENVSDGEYTTQILSVVADYFGGYSISHVQGRFRADVLTDIVGAAQGVIDRKRYLIDETTAVVRFIAPCKSTRQEFDSDFDSIFQALAEYDKLNQSVLVQEIILIRCLFFFFFVEAVVRTVKGEDEIWLIETGLGRRLYTWSKQTDLPPARKTRSKRR